MPCEKSTKPGSPSGTPGFQIAFTILGWSTKPAVGDRRVADGELHRRRRQQTLPDRQLHVVAGEVAAALVLADHAEVGVPRLELLVGHRAVELERQVDAGVGAEPELLDLLLQHRPEVVARP